MVKIVRQGVLLLLIFFGITMNAFALTSDAPSLQLTEQEKEYFAQLDTLRVLTVPNVQPYAYQNTGVSIDILQRLCAAANVELQLVETESYADALSRLDQGEADIVAVKISPQGEDNRMVAYLQVPLQIVSHRQAALSKQSNLSIVQLQEIEFFYEHKYAFVEEMSLPTVRDCLDAVRGRRADIFLCDIYQLSVFSDSFAARDLAMNNLPQHEITVGFGVGKNADDRLVSTLQKAVDSVPTSELSKMLMGHMQYHEPGFKMIQFVYQNPFELLCAVTSLFFVILLCFFVSFKIRVGQHQELRGYEESYRMLADTFGEAGIEYDFLNDRFTFFGGRRHRLDLPEVVEDVHTVLANHALRFSLTPEELDELLENNSPNHSYEVELQCGMKEGNWNWFRLIYIVVCTSESHRRPIRLIGCLVNIEAEHREKERLMQIGYHDKLTGLLNRAAGENEIAQALHQDNRPKVLLFLDIDYFKGFNDRYGHSCGDEVLSVLGSALQESFSSEDILCRWGGDEFLLLIQGVDVKSVRLHGAIKQLQKRMQAFAYLDKSLPVTLSIGGVVGLPGVTFQALFELVDSTLYTVKENGRNNVRIIYPMSDIGFSAKEEGL